MRPFRTPESWRPLYDRWIARWITREAVPFASATKCRVNFWQRSSWYISLRQGGSRTRISRKQHWRLRLQAPSWRCQQHGRKSRFIDMQRWRRWAQRAPLTRHRKPQWSRMKPVYSGQMGINVWMLKLLQWDIIAKWGKVVDGGDIGVEQNVGFEDRRGKCESDASSIECHASGRGALTSPCQSPHLRGSCRWCLLSWRTGHLGFGSPILLEQRHCQTRCPRSEPWRSGRMDWKRLMASRLFQRDSILGTISGDLSKDNS